MVCDNYIHENNNAYLNESDIKNKNAYEKKLNDWIIEHNDKFNLVAVNMNKTKEHQHWRVKLQLVSSCNELLKNCTR